MSSRRPARCQQRGTAGEAEGCQGPPAHSSVAAWCHQGWGLVTPYCSHWHCLGLGQSSTLPLPRVHRGHHMSTLLTFQGPWWQWGWVSQVSLQLCRKRNGRSLWVRVTAWGVAGPGGVSAARPLRNVPSMWDVRALRCPNAAILALCGGGGGRGRGADTVNGVGTVNRVGTVNGLGTVSAVGTVLGGCQPQGLRWGGGLRWVPITSPRPHVPP